MCDGPLGPPALNVCVMDASRNGCDAILTPAVVIWCKFSGFLVTNVIRAFGHQSFVQQLSRIHLNENRCEEVIVGYFLESLVNSLHFKWLQGASTSQVPRPTPTRLLRRQRNMCERNLSQFFFLSRHGDVVALKILMITNIDI